MLHWHFFCCLGVSTVAGRVCELPPVWEYTTQRTADFSSNMYITELLPSIGRSRISSFLQKSFKRMNISTSNLYWFRSNTSFTINLESQNMQLYVKALGCLCLKDRPSNKDSVSQENPPNIRLERLWCSYLSPAEEFEKGKRFSSWKCKDYSVKKNAIDHPGREIQDSFTWKGLGVKARDDKDRS